jgi:tetratricopeptide (TPR) repeat protein
MRITVIRRAFARLVALSLAAFPLAASTVAFGTAESRSPSEQVQVLLQSGEEALLRGELARAEHAFFEAAGIALDQLGTIYGTLNDYGIAERAYQRALQFPGVSARPLPGLALAYLRTGRYEEGLEVVGRFLRIRPGDPQAVHLRGKLHYVMGRFDSAARDLAIVLADSPDDVAVAYTLGLAHLHQGETEKAEDLFSGLVARLGDSAALRSLFGRAFRETEHWELAVREFETAIALDPEHPRVYYNLGVTYLRWHGAADTEPAMRAFEAELERDGEQYLPNLYIGLIHRTRGEDELALGYFRKAAAMEPGNPDPYLHIGRILSRIGETEEAIQALERSIELTADPARNNYQVSGAHFVLGQALMKRGRLEEGRVHIARAQELRRLSHQVVTRTLLGSATQRSTGMSAQPSLEVEPESGTLEPDVEVSADSLTAFLASEIAPSGADLILHEPPPDHATVELLRDAARVYRRASSLIFQALARLEVAKDRPLEAARYLEEALSWDDGLPKVRFNLAVALVRAGEMEAAVDPLIDHLREEPSDPAATRLLAEVSLRLTQTGEASAALRTLDYLLEGKPGLAELWLLRGQTHARLDRHDLATEDFRKADALNPELPELHFLLGLSLLEEGNAAEALIHFERELTHNPEHVPALFQKAVALMRRSRADEADPPLRRVIALRPNHPDAHHELGKIQLSRDELAPAVASLETAARLDSTLPDVFSDLAEAYRRSGRNDDADRALARHRESMKDARPVRIPTPEEP